MEIYCFELEYGILYNKLRQLYGQKRKIRYLNSNTRDYLPWLLKDSIQLTKDLPSSVAKYLKERNSVFILLDDERYCEIDDYEAHNTGDKGQTILARLLFIMSIHSESVMPWRVNAPETQPPVD